MNDPSDTLLDGSIADVLDTMGEHGRALVAASSVADSPETVGVVLYAEGCVHHDVDALDTIFCDEMMGEPDKPGLWVWEGFLRVDDFSDPDDPDTSYDGQWRPARPHELALYQEGAYPFRKVTQA